MRKVRFIEHQIIAMLKPVETGSPEASYYFKYPT